MHSIQKHTILLTTIFLWSCISVLAGEVREFHFLKDRYVSGERTVKSSGENAAMFVNAEFAGGTTNTAKFSLYVSPYLVANQGGRYTKHVYIGSQRIVSKLGDLKSYGADPRRIEYAGSESDGPKVDYKTKYAQQQQVIKDNFAHFDVPYNGADNNDYVDGKGFSERDGSLKSAMLKAAMAKEGNKSVGLKDNFQQGDSYEQYQYFYHPDHLGSSSFITNTEGEVVQHIEYVPYGEVFIEERNNVWNTPYLFNAKEFDEETGLYYYGARYYDSRLAMWYGVDALAEEYPNMSPYNYCVGNPVKLIDPDGTSPIFSKDGVLFGTDDEGIRGFPIIMDAKNFVQGMKHIDTWKFHLGEDALVSSQARNIYMETCNSLSDRPDYWGELTLSSANEWYRSGSGGSLYVDSKLIDLSPLTTKDFKDGEGSSMFINFASPKYANMNTGLVYGNIKVTLLDAKTGEVQLGNANGLLDVYDFDQKKGGNTFRNIATQIGQFVAGDGEAYNIYTYNHGYIKVEE